MDSDLYTICITCHHNSTIHVITKTSESTHNSHKHYASHVLMMPLKQGMGMTFTLVNCGRGNLFTQNLHKKYGLQNLSPYSTPKLLLRLQSYPTHLALLVELFPVSLIHEPSWWWCWTQGHSLSNSWTLVNSSLGQDFTQQPSLPAKRRSWREEGRCEEIRRCFLEWRGIGWGIDSSTQCS